jgi:chaperonin GroES
MATATSTLQPLADRVVVKPLPSEETTKGGIILPGTAQEKPTKGTVIAVGPGRILDDGKNSPMHVKAGDTVLYGKYSGTEIKLEGEEYVIIKESELFGILH